MNRYHLCTYSSVEKIILSIMIAIFLPATACALHLPEANESYLARYLTLYGYSLDDENVNSTVSAELPQYIDCGSVQVCLNEVIYDGQMLLTAASVHMYFRNGEMGRTLTTISYL